MSLLRIVEGVLIGIAQLRHIGIDTAELLLKHRSHGGIGHACVLIFFLYLKHI